MRTARLTNRLLAAGLGLTALAACTHHPHRPPRSTTTTTTTTTTTAPSAALLVHWTGSGGLGLQEFTVRRDGAWHATSTVGDHPAQEKDGQLDPAATRQLIERVEAQVGSLAGLEPAPETCPSAYDAFDYTFTINAGGHTTMVSNCDRRHPEWNRVVPGGNDLLTFLLRLRSRLADIPPSVNTVLVQWTATGGFCAGACPVDRVDIDEDGSWQALRGTNWTYGRLDLDTLAALTQLIDEGANALDELPPASYCPSAADGRDVDVTFFSGGDWDWVSNCRRRFAGNALLERTSAIVAGFF